MCGVCVLNTDNYVLYYMRAHTHRVKEKLLLVVCGSSFSFCSSVFHSLPFSHVQFTYCIICLYVCMCAVVLDSVWLFKLVSFQTFNE